METLEVLKDMPTDKLLTYRNVLTLFIEDPQGGEPKFDPDDIEPYIAYHKQAAAAARGIVQIESILRERGVPLTSYEEAVG